MKIDDVFNGVIASAIWELLKWITPATVSWLIRKGINLRNATLNIIAFLAVLLLLYVISLLAGQVITFILILGLLIYGLYQATIRLKGSGGKKILQWALVGVSFLILLAGSILLYGAQLLEPAPLGVETNAFCQNDFSQYDINNWPPGDPQNDNVVDSVTVNGNVVSIETTTGNLIEWMRLYANYETSTYFKEKDFDLTVCTTLKQYEPTNQSVWLTLHFRITEDFANYSLQLNQYQQYRLVYYPGSFPILHDWEKNEAINPLEEGNKIRIVADGIQFNIYINDQLVTTTPLQDSRQNVSGGFALGVRANQGTFVKVDFENLRICEKSCEQ